MNFSKTTATEVTILFYCFNRQFLQCIHSIYRGAVEYERTRYTKISFCFSVVYFSSTLRTAWHTILCHNGRFPSRPWILMHVVIICSLLWQNGYFPSKPRVSWMINFISGRRLMLWQNAYFPSWDGWFSIIWTFCCALTPSDLHLRFGWSPVMSC